MIRSTYCWVFWPAMPTTAAGLITPPDRPVPSTPVGRTIVTLIFPCDSTRSELDSVATAALVAEYTPDPAVPALA